MRAFVHLAQRSTSLVQFMCAAIATLGDAVADAFELDIAKLVKYVSRLAALCTVSSSTS